MSSQDETTQTTDELKKQTDDAYRKRLESHEEKVRRYDRG